MRRIAAHHIYWKGLRPLHVIETDDDGRFCRVFPLTEEIAETEFWDGLIYPVPASWKEKVTVDSLASLAASGITEHVKAGSLIVVHKLE